MTLVDLSVVVAEGDAELDQRLSDELDAVNLARTPAASAAGPGGSPRASP